jgi:hypothetical protein
MNSSIAQLSLPLADMMRQLQEMREVAQETWQEPSSWQKSCSKPCLHESALQICGNRRWRCDGYFESATATVLNALADLAQRQEHILENTQHIDRKPCSSSITPSNRLDADAQRLQQELNKLTKLSWELSRQAHQYRVSMRHFSKSAAVVETFADFTAAC